MGYGLLKMKLYLPFKGNINLNRIGHFLGKPGFLLKRAFKILAFVYLGLGAVLFIFQGKYIYIPDKTDFSDCPEFKEAEKITFGSSRGYFTLRSSDKVIIFYHGNAGRACDRSYLDSLFAKYGYSTYFAEYSGYAGKNDPSMSALLGNVTDTIEFLDTQKFKDVMVVGKSLGVGPAAYHASLKNISKLILITPYNNLADVAFSHYPVYPTRLLFLNNFTPDIWLSGYKGPAALIIAENDEVMPRKLGKKLFEGIPSSSKSIFIIEDSGHNTIYEKEEFYNTLEGEL